MEDIRWIKTDSGYASEDGAWVIDRVHGYYNLWHKSELLAKRVSLSEAKQIAAGYLATEAESMQEPEPPPPPEETIPILRLTEKPPLRLLTGPTEPPIPTLPNGEMGPPTSLKLSPPEVHLKTKSAYDPKPGSEGWVIHQATLAVVEEGLPLTVANVWSELERRGITLKRNKARLQSHFSWLCKHGHAVRVNRGEFRLL